MLQLEAQVTIWAYKWHLEWKEVLQDWALYLGTSFYLQADRVRGELISWTPERLAGVGKLHRNTLELGPKSSCFFLLEYYLRASPLGQKVKNLPTMRETWVWSLGRGDPLEKGVATHSSIFVWRIPWTEEPGGIQSMGSRRVRQDWATNTFAFISG